MRAGDRVQLPTMGAGIIEQVLDGLPLLLVRLQNGQTYWFPKDIVRLADPPKRRRRSA